tara:strand:- start:508752 stop:510977 length:2226 start_codon:yes stop_codon:yes gene_type:complete
MTDITTPIRTTDPSDAPLVGAPLTAASIDQDHARIGKLLIGLQESTGSSDAFTGADRDTRFENQLALVRLGMATSLFYALRTKHAPTAVHSLRVALSCSAWCQRLELSDEDRDRIEVAALLHDLGKIGVPDRILRKPGKLTVDEQLTMDCCPELGCEILRGCTSDIELLSIVRYSNTWFDSRRQAESTREEKLPLGARMLAITDAFDAMTTDTVYRPAMSRERAVKQLIEGSGTQFDPELAIDFSRMLEQRPEMLQGVVVNRWLQQLRPDVGDQMWSGSPVSLPVEQDTVRRETLFHQQLLGTMKDGAVFTDREGTVTQWNHVMHRITGIPDSAIVGQTWTMAGIGLSHGDDSSRDCPVYECLHQGTSTTRKMAIMSSSGAMVPVHLQVSPVIGPTPGTHGAVVVIRDLSDQTNLEEKIETLHQRSTLDPLTGVANRALFDETIKKMTAETVAGGPSFSLIICDIDHFKRVNDVHGHPAGDEALINFASILGEHSRDGDLVARYGGEEFLLLAVNCDNATAATRAEAIRAALERTPLNGLGGESVTSSFGVTEFQAGDSAETVLARADRALLKAKDNGRNRVIQLGTGKHIDYSEKASSKRGWLNWLGGNEGTEHNDVDIVTPVPIDLAIEKLRGFIADHGAEIVHVTESQLSLKVNGQCTTGGRRRVDHQIALAVMLTLSETIAEGDQKRKSPCQTKVHVHVTPIRNRDRRNRELKTCVDQLVVSLRSYLMGKIVSDDTH